MCKTNKPATIGRFIATLFLLFSLQAAAQRSYNIQMLETPPINSIRGMVVVNDSVVWVSGTGGKVGITDSGGKQWTWLTVPGYDSLDWRSIHAFSKKRALLLNAGEPASLVLSTDSGFQWKQVFHDDTKGIFFDGMAFNKDGKGAAIGDPLPGSGEFTLLQTRDTGLSWQRVKAPDAEDGEAIFAASNTSMRMLRNGDVCFVTGGKVSRFFRKNKSTILPVVQGKNSTGAFSVAFSDDRNGVVVGGDYLQDTLCTRNCAYTHDGGRTWQLPVVPPGGYRSCVQFIRPGLLIATGPTGTDLSEDGGKHWTQISPAGFHVAGVSPSGNKVFLAGSKKLAVIEMKKGVLEKHPR